MQLLPSAHQAPVISEAAGQFRETFERRVVFLIISPNFDTASEVANFMESRLAQSKQFEALQLRLEDNVLEQSRSLLEPHRFQLLSDRARNRLKKQDWEAFQRDLLTRYSSPISIINSDLVAVDPLLLLPDFLNERIDNISQFRLSDGYLTRSFADRTVILLDAELAASPYSLETQDAVVQLIDQLRAEVAQQFNEASFLVSGAVLHANAGTKTAQTEISIIATGSLVGIIGLFIVIFRSWRPLVMTTTLVAISCLSGFAACVILFGEVSLLTLVFGASLVGTAVDYALHFFCECFQTDKNWSSRAALDHVFPGITLGLVTTIAGFAALLWAPFPALKQIAVFSIFGLAFAYATVVIFGPFLMRSPLSRGRPNTILNLLNSYARIWHQPWRPQQIVFGILAFIVLSIGIVRLDVLDDIRLFQSLDPILVEEDKKVRDIIGQIPSPAFFVVHGETVDDVLQHEETLTKSLRELQNSGQIAHHQAISDLVPSPLQQNQNRQLLEQFINDTASPLDDIGDAIGLDEKLIASYRDAFAQSKMQGPLGVEDWLASPMARAYRDLWLGLTDKGYISIVSLFGVKDPAILYPLADKLDGVSFTDQVGELSTLFADQRNIALKLTMFIYLVVTLALMLRYGIRGAVYVMAPSCIAAIASFGILGLAGQTINLFNAMALLLMLGIGVDYSLFYRETGRQNDTTILAIAASAVTSILAFGLLAFSSTSALQAFGLTIMIGISIAFLLSPIAGTAVARR